MTLPAKTLGQMTFESDGVTYSVHVTALHTLVDGPRVERHMYLSVNEGEPHRGRQLAVVEIGPMRHGTGPVVYAATVGRPVTPVPG